MPSTYWLKAFLLLTMVRMAIQDTTTDTTDYYLTCFTDNRWGIFSRLDFVKGVLNLFLKADDPQPLHFERFTILPTEIYLPLFPGGDATKQRVTLTVSGNAAFVVLDNRQVQELTMQSISRKDLYDSFDFVFKQCCKEALACRGGSATYKRPPGFRILLQVPVVHPTVAPNSGSSSLMGHNQVPVDYVYRGYIELFCGVKNFHKNDVNDFHNRLGHDGAIEVHPNQLLVLYRHQSLSREPVQFVISADNSQQPIRVPFQLISSILAQAIAHSCSIYETIPSLCSGATASVPLGGSQIHVSYSLAPQYTMHSLGIPHDDPNKKSFPNMPGDDYSQETADYIFTCYRKDKWPNFSKQDFEDGMATMFPKIDSEQVTFLPEVVSLPLFPRLASPESPIKQRTTLTTRGNLRFSALDKRNFAEIQWLPRNRADLEHAFEFVHRTCCTGAQPCRGGSATSKRSPGLQIFLEEHLSQPIGVFDKAGQILAKHVYDGYVESFCQHKNPPPDFHHLLGPDSKFRVPPNRVVKLLHVYRPRADTSVLFTISNQNPTLTALVPFGIISSMMSHAVAQCIILSPRSMCVGKEVDFNFGGSTISIGYERAPEEGGQSGGQQGPSAPQTNPKDDSAKQGKRTMDQGGDPRKTKKGKQTAGKAN
ncbi:unnamed protein product [Calypogeia fissa]